MRARQQPADLVRELTGRREAKHIDADLGVEALGDALRPVECYLCETGVCEHPERAPLLLLWLMVSSLHVSRRLRRPLD